MGNKPYVRNLAYSIADGDLRESFAQYGTVASARVMMDRESGRSKGFGFVEMGDDSQAHAAVAGLNGQALGGRNLVVNEARPMEPRPPRSATWGFGPGRSGSGGYGGGLRGSEGGNTGGFRSPYGNGPRGGNRGGGGKSY